MTDVGVGDGRRIDGAFPLQAVDRYKYFGRWNILEQKKICQGFPLSTTGAKI